MRRLDRDREALTVALWYSAVGLAPVGLLSLTAPAHPLVEIPMVVVFSAAGILCAFGAATRGYIASLSGLIVAILAATARGSLLLVSDRTDALLGTYLWWWLAAGWVVLLAQVVRSVPVEIGRP